MVNLSEGTLMSHVFTVQFNGWTIVGIGVGYAIGNFLTELSKHIFRNRKDKKNGRDAA